MKRVFICIVAVFITLSVSAQELKVGSFNIKCGTSHGMGYYESGNGWDDRKGFLCDLINFTAFDVFGAQEVRHGQLTDMVAALPDYAYIGVGRDDGKTKGEFSPVFYRRERLKLLDSGTFWLSETPEEVSRGWDAACNRICSWGYFQDKVTKAKFYFLNTHIDNRGAVAKTKSVELILKFIEERGKDVKAIVTGDMNVNQNSEWYKQFVATGVLKDSFVAAKYRFAPSGTFSTFTPTRYSTNRIDHIFVSKDIVVERYGVLTLHYWKATDEENYEGVRFPADIEKREVLLLSDHYPVQVNVLLNGAKKR
ncbi:MAG: endonuclease/exonuclease/phosphatase family protein [Alistipes sp.]|nr:endonuclease/exonuclease/phosphatase family protein [Alistipes sp.]